MKIPSFLIGLIVGGSIVFIWMSLLKLKNEFQRLSPLTKTANWKWADSLDAVKAAPNSHQVLFENDKIRILEVTLEPYGFEPMHTHQYPSVMFGAGNDTSQFDVVYYPYGYDSVRQVYFARDSIKQHQGGPSNEPNTGSFMNPEGPHRVKNLSKTRIDAFRVELKNDIKK